MGSSSSAQKIKPSKPTRPTRHTEIERKFDVVESTVAPSFDGLSAVSGVERSPAQHLDAVYYDTPRHDLAGHRITLRRRTGGPDAGWHLKLPAGPDSRTEVRMPLDSSNGGDSTGGGPAPNELLDVVLAIVRDRPVAPVARITTVRIVDTLYGTDGSALAEFCDDQVSAWAAANGDGEDSEQRWREWELELVDGAGDVPGLLERLSNRLLDAGAVPAGHGSKLARVLHRTGGEPDVPAGSPADGDAMRDAITKSIAANVAELLEWDRAVRSDTEDSVHQMRVTTRKIRSLLQEAKGAGDDSDPGYAWVLDELRQLAGVLGVARDAEVLAQRYDRALGELAPDLVRGPVRGRLVDGAQRRYQAGLRRSLTAMRSPRYFRLLDALDDLATPGAAPAVGAQTQPIGLDAAYKRVRKAAAVAADTSGRTADQRDEALHRIRKGAKRLRYTAAATGAASVSDAAKTIQTLLGDHQDSVVSRTHLREQASAAYTGGEDTFTYGVLYQQEDDIARASRRRLDQALQMLAKAVSKSGARGGRAGL